MIGNDKMSILHPDCKHVFETDFAILQISIINYVERYPEALYYYTSDFDMLNNIIHNRELCLINLAFLNSHSKLDYIRSLVDAPTLSGIKVMHRELKQAFFLITAKLVNIKINLRRR